jgi:hypothetical protein
VRHQWGPLARREARHSPAEGHSLDVGGRVLSVVVSGVALYDPQGATLEPGRFDVQGLMAGVERASPLDAAEVLARQFARALAR